MTSQADFSEVDEYAYYYACLAGKNPVHPEAPQPGRYRIPARQTQHGDRPLPRSWPVAIWRGEDGATIARIGSRLIREGDGEPWHEFACNTWLRCVAVPSEQYDAVVAGGSWPDEHEAVTRLSNQPPPDDSVEAVEDRIKDLAREAERLIEAGAATSKEESDRAADLANMLGKLETRADELRAQEKAPHLQASRDVDARWKAPIDLAKTIKERLKRIVVTPFLRAEAAKADKARFEQMTLGTKPEDVPEAKITAGTRGRPAALRAVKKAVIEDFDALLAALKEHPDIRAAVEKVAQTSARNNIALPGMRIVTEQVAA